MLATKPAGASAAYTLARATAEIMWACAFATARVAVASTARNLELWSRMLYPPAGGPDRPLPLPASDTAAARRRPSAAPADPIPFARYRTSSGHAATQVIVSD